MTGDCVIDEGSFDISSILKAVKDELASKGIDFEKCCRGAGGDAGDDGECCSPRVKIVCVAPNLGETREEIGRSPRDQVVMVRVDEPTAAKLDAWVETGAAKSRSEAAAMFINEGLKVRASELEKLNDALREVREARERLHREAREAFGMGEE